MNEIAKQIESAIRYARDRAAELAEYGAHPDFDPRGVVAPRVGAVLHSILTEPRRDWHDDPVGETAFGAYVRGDHDALPLLGQALRDEGHPFASKFNWDALPFRVGLDKKILAIHQPQINENEDRIYWRGQASGVEEPHTELAATISVLGPLAHAGTGNAADAIWRQLPDFSEEVDGDREQRTKWWREIRASLARLNEHASRQYDAADHADFPLTDLPGYPTQVQHSAKMMLENKPGTKYRDFDADDLAAYRGVHDD